MTNYKTALYLNTVVSLSMGVVFALTMKYSSNGGIVGPAQKQTSMLNC